MTKKYQQKTKKITNNLPKNTKTDKTWTKMKKVDQKCTKNRPTNYKKNTKKLTKKYQQCYQKNTKTDKTLTDIRADIRADVLNPIMFINCNVFNTKEELIHLVLRDHTYILKSLFKVFQTPPPSLIP